MVYVQVLMGLAAVLLGAGLAIYLSTPNRAPPHQHPRRRRDDDDDDTTPFGSSVRELGVRAQRTRPTRVGDTCCICLNTLDATMHVMNCKHALHLDCFSVLKHARNTCPICFARVVRHSQPGDQCTICLTAMSNDDMQYMNCEHAIHKKCLLEYKEKMQSNTCPLCRANI
ncbi:RING-H2 finger protein ATL32 [Scaptodrosophila lebanonensis]|uniref:RING-H2 finger protein ATL32 n=1 Tax=Drosophila lebanonensis TaxID=7225 RepID=A0A6J2TCX8_DROLE|nr:RING-H2 finger protein ATL32 [Scaptodrosophila lebanonensis]